MAQPQNDEIEVASIHRGSLAASPLLFSLSAKLCTIEAIFHFVWSEEENSKYLIEGCGVDSEQVC